MQGGGVTSHNADFQADAGARAQPRGGQISIRLLGIDSLLPVTSWCLDAPEAGSFNTELHQSYLAISGWVHVEAPLHYVAIYSDLCYRSLLMVSVLHRRPDVNQALSLADDVRTGFRFHVNLLGLQDHKYIYVCFVSGAEISAYSENAAFPAGNFGVIARIRFQVTVLGSPGGLGPAPLFVTSIGRSGTTALMSAFLRSPEVYTGRTHPYENRMLSYFIHLARISVTPSTSYLPVGGASFLDHPFLASTNPFINPTEHSVEFEFFDHHSIEIIRGALLSIINSLATIEGGDPMPVFVAEKLVPNTLIASIAETIWPESREIILVRRFEDWLRSAILFSRQSGLYFTDTATVSYIVSRINVEVSAFLEYYKARASKIFLLKFEEMTLGKSWGKRLGEFLGVEVTPEMVDAIRSPLASHTTSGGSVDYQAEMHPHEIETMRRLGRRYNEVFGYPRERKP
jgi:hypothetical protein